MRAAIAFVVTVFASLAAAQDVGGVPPCAQGCAQQAIGKCGLKVDCICEDQGLIDTLSCCVFNSCPTEEERKPVIDFAQAICAQTNAKLPQQASCAAGSSSTPSPSSNPTSSAPTGSNTGAAGKNVIGAGAVAAGLLALL